MHPEYTPDFIARFWSRVDMSRGALSCWLWQASKDTTGYGHVGIGGRLYQAHRVAYELLKGPIPEGLCLMHSCDVRDCVNPRHLTPGTYADNNRDTMTKQRHVAPRGEAHPSCKLTEAQVREIRRRREAGEEYATLAQDFGVTRGMIGHIVRRVSWKHVA